MINYKKVSDASGKLLEVDATLQRIAAHWASLPNLDEIELLETSLASVAASVEYIAKAFADGIYNPDLIEELVNSTAQAADSIESIKSAE